MHLDFPSWGHSRCVPSIKLAREACPAVGGAEAWRPRGPGWSPSSAMTTWGGHCTCCPSVYSPVHRDNCKSCSTSPCRVATGLSKEGHALLLLWANAKDTEQSSLGLFQEMSSAVLHLGVMGGGRGVKTPDAWASCRPAEPEAPGEGLSEAMVRHGSHTIKVTHCEIFHKDAESCNFHQNPISEHLYHPQKTLWANVQSLPVLGWGVLKLPG